MTEEDFDRECTTIDTIGTHVYFYSDIVPDRALALMRALREKDGTLRAEALSRGASVPPIWLHVYSEGGELPVALGLADQIAALPIRVHSVIEGMAASAGSILAMACHRRYITPRSTIMIHQLACAVAGTHEEHRDAMVYNEILMRQLGDFYVEHSTLTRDKIEAMLRRDTWLTASQALEYGMVDEIAR